MRTSRTRHAGTSGSLWRRNSYAKEKLSTCKPTERIRLSSDSRTAASSSTTKTTGESRLASDLTSQLRLDRQSKLKRDARPIVRCHPETPAVRLDNGAADRQSHP